MGFSDILKSQIEVISDLLKYRGSLIDEDEAIQNLIDIIRLEFKQVRHNTRETILKEIMEFTHERWKEYEALYKRTNDDEILGIVSGVKVVEAHLAGMLDEKERTSGSK